MKEAMELDESETEGGTVFPDESSGSESAYEISDNEQSHDEDAAVIPTSRAGYERERSRNMPKSHSKKSRNPGPESQEDPSTSPNPEVFEDAAEWAASFKEPKLEDIKTPPRLSRGGKKRKAPKPPTETRIKRLKSYYNNDYRELLNSEIQDAASSVADSGNLKQSQIGSSIWTAAEKAVLFTALERLGRDDVRGIAERIGSKSQHEVQEYVNLLHQGTMERKQNDYQILAPTDIPAAVEISEECAAVLERAGDSLAAHQELAEEKVEKGKWGDSWLINADVALQMKKRRNQVAGEEEVEEVFPAANLLDLSNWIELSDQIFMNAGSDREEDNWHAIAEPGQAPAVRATAFENFHSLAFNITKRLVSTALFCSMSRLRARGSNRAKHAEVNADDVEAAINILGLKANSHEFWRGVAKRNHLQVIDDDRDAPVLMSYNEVEKALRERHPRVRSRSASRSRIRSEQPELSSIYAQQEDVDSSPADIDEEEQDSHSEFEYASLPNSDEEFMSSSAPESTSSDSESLARNVRITTPDAQQSAETALDAHTEAHDMYTSQTSEIQLWKLLKQAPPFEFTLEPVLEKAPKGGRDELAERENWREYVGYVGVWEEMGLVGEEEFVRNRRRMERANRRRAERVEEDGEGDGDGVGDGDVGLDEEDEEDGDGDESTERPLDNKDAQQRGIAITEEQEEEEDEDIDEQDDDEHLQVESPRQEIQSPDRESEVSQSGAMMTQS